MTIRRILRYPDMGLSVPCAAVEVFDDGLKQLAQDLIDTMHAAPGVGITAAHIGILKRIVVIELEGQLGARIFVNPQILSASTTVQSFDEGSVSMPGAIDSITRPSEIRLRYQTLDGAVHQEEMTGFLATCMQHEIDQLDGIFWLQRLSRLKRERLVRKWEKSQPPNRAG